MKKTSQVIHISLSERDDPDALELAQGLEDFMALHEIETQAKALRALLKLGLDHQGHKKPTPKFSRILQIAKLKGGRKNWHTLGMNPNP